MPRHRIGLIIFLVLAVVVFYTTLKYLHRGGEVTGGLYEPAIILVRVGEIPVPKEQVNPVEAMTDLPLPVSCDIVPPSVDGETASFKLTAQGKSKESDTCKGTVALVGNPGDKATVELEYLVTSADGTVRTADKKSVEVVLLRHREFLRIRALEKEDEQPIASVQVPRKVIPYVDAALKLDGDPADYVVLFFVQPMGGTGALLQVVSVKDEPGSFEMNTAPMKRFRTWGGSLHGYAAWPGGAEPGSGLRPPAIEIGDDSDDKQVFEIFAGLFQESDLPAVRAAAISVRTGENGEAEVSLREVPIEEMRTLAWNGWFSESLRVIRSDTAGSVSPMSK
jgi:hypothetical protein